MMIVGPSRSGGMEARCDDEGRSVRSTNLYGKLVHFEAFEMIDITDISIIYSFVVSI